MDSTAPTPIVLIGWQSADWPMIEQLLDEGRMPCLQGMIDRGVMGRLAAFTHLTVPAALWTTLLTGHRAEVHGIVDAVEPTPDGQSLIPVGAASRQVPALWHHFSSQGKRVLHVGWPASHPAESINGVGVSGLYDLPVAPFGAPWPVAAGSVFPDSMAGDLAELRLHPGELSADDLRGFLPLIQETDLERDPRPFRLARHLASTLSRQAAFTYLLQREPWDFAAILFPTLHRVAREFYRYHPPKAEGVPEGDFARYSQVMRECCCLEDQMLRPILESAAKMEATVILCSPCGLRPTWLRSPVTPDAEPRSGALLRPGGWCVLLGPGIRSDELLHGAHLLDLAPTLLWRAGLTRDRTMPGTPLFRAWRDPGSICTDTAWNPEKDDENLGVTLAPMPTPVRELKPVPGVLESPTGASELVARAIVSRNYQFGLALLDAQRPAEALPLLLSARGSPAEGDSATLALIACYRALGRIADARELLENLAQSSDGSGRLAVETPRQAPEFDLMRGLLTLDEGRFGEALPHLEKAILARPQIPEMHLHLGRILMRLGRPELARNAFLKSLELDPELAEADLGLAQALSRLRRFHEAVQPALNAATRMPHRYSAHLLLGLCLARTGARGEAITALENALRTQPGIAVAHRVLARLYRGDRQNAWRSQRHSDAARLLRHARNASKRSAATTRGSSTAIPTKLPHD